MKPIINEQIDKKVALYLQQQRVATIACVSNANTPYCFNCYYVFNNEDVLLYFKSSADTIHMKYLKDNFAVAGSILPDKLSTLLTRGIQFTGTIINSNSLLALNATEKYYDKIPFAKMMNGEVVVVRIDTIKMTDSSLGIGKKIRWKREEHLS